MKQHNIPIQCGISNDCRRRLLSDVGGSCFDYIHAKFISDVFYNRITPVQQNSEFLKEALRRSAQGMRYRLSIGIPFAKSEKYKSILLLLIKKTEEFQQYVVIENYRLSERPGKNN